MEYQRQRERKRVSKFIGLGAKIVISLGAIWYLTTKIDQDLLIETIGGANLGLILAAIMALALQPLLATIRWWELLRAILAHARFGRILQIIYVSLFFNQVLPASIGGDVIRVWLVRRDGCSLSKAVTSVFIDRVVMVLILLILVVSGYFMLNRSFDIFESGSVAASAGILFVFSLVFILLIAFRTDLIGFVSARLREFVEAPVQQFRMFLVNPRALISVSFFCLVSHFNIILTVFLLMQAFDARASFIEVVSITPLVLLAATLPISLGGWGVRELAMVTAFGQLGISETASLSASVLLGIISIVVTLPGAAIFATLRHASITPGTMPGALEPQEASRRP